jgi:hypothetical protein
MRDKVRELTGIFATDVIPDTLVNQWLNEQLYSIQTSFDDLSDDFFQPSLTTTSMVRALIGTVVSGATTTYTYTETYTIPGQGNDAFTHNFKAGDAVIVNGIASLSNVARIVTQAPTTAYGLNSNLAAMSPQTFVAQFSTTTSLSPGTYTGTGTVRPSPLVLDASGVSYNFPAWKWDNTTKFPSGVAADLYMESDADTAPWDNGYYDNYLVYAVSAILLKHLADDTKRGESYLSMAKEILDNLISREFIGWNKKLIDLRGEYITNRYLKQGFMVFCLLGEYTDIEWDMREVRRMLENEELELQRQYPSLSASIVLPELTAYSVAARLAARRGNEQLASTLLTERTTRLESLRKDATGTLPEYYSGANDYRVRVLSSTRALVNDISSNLGEGLLQNWIDDAITTLSYERDWSWMQRETEVTLGPGVSYSIDGTQVYASNWVSLAFLASGGVSETSTWSAPVRILNAYAVKTNQSGTSDVQIVSPAPHGLDVEYNNSKYTYHLDYTPGEQRLYVSPPPTEQTTFRIRHTITPLTSEYLANDLLPFSPLFYNVISYRVAIKALAYGENPNAKLLIPIYREEEQKLFEALEKATLLAGNAEPFSIGENALETRKYLPQFKAI